MECRDRRLPDHDCNCFVEALTRSETMKSSETALDALTLERNKAEAELTRLREALNTELCWRIKRYKKEIAKRVHALINSLEWKVRIEFEAQRTECEDLFRALAEGLRSSKEKLERGVPIREGNGGNMLDEEMGLLQSDLASAAETGWLIERGGLCLGFCEYRFAWVTLTNENALRFARQRDGYSFMECCKWTPFDLRIEGAKVTEHVWG
jgi:hypothetical protein